MRRVGYMYNAVVARRFPEILHVQSPERTQTRFGSELIRQTLVARDAKALGLPGLFARNIVREDDPRVPMTSTEFLAEAWKVANDKARELGWIV
jgi:hypothetical protein